jgi:hypothetical protein
MYMLSAVTQVTKEKQAAVPQKKKLMPQISLVNAYRQVSELNGFLNTKGSITTLLADVPNLKVSVSYFRISKFNNAQNYFFLSGCRHRIILQYYQ